MEDQHVPPISILLWSSSCFGWFSKMKSIIMRIKSRIGYEFGYFGPWSNLPSVIGLSHILIFSWIMCFKLNSFRLPSQHNFWHTSLFRWTHLSFKIITYLKLSMIQPRLTTVGHFARYLNTSGVTFPPLWPTKKTKTSTNIQKPE